MLRMLPLFGSRSLGHFDALRTFGDRHAPLLKHPRHLGAHEMLERLWLAELADVAVGAVARGHHVEAEEVHLAGWQRGG